MPPLSSSAFSSVNNLCRNHAQKTVTVESAYYSLHTKKTAMILHSESAYFVPCLNIFFL
jgi:hypothetical protein